MKGEGGGSENPPSFCLQRGGEGCVCRNSLAFWPEGGGFRNPPSFGPKGGGVSKFLSLGQKGGGGGFRNPPPLLATKAGRVSNPPLLLGGRGGVSKPPPFWPKAGGGLWGFESTLFWARKGEGGALKSSSSLLAKKGGVRPLRAISRDNRASRGALFGSVTIYVAFIT